jgi:transposase
MVWACIMTNRKGPLVVLEYPGGKGGGMNAQRYREQVLDPVVLSFVEQAMRERGGDVSFMQDGAPSHRARATKSWFARYGIPLFPHPSHSPDMNPIERLWCFLKARIRARPHQPKNFEELKAAALEEWDALTLEEVNKCIHMDERLEAVIKAEGGATRF